MPAHLAPRARCPDLAQRPLHRTALLRAIALAAVVALLPAAGLAQTLPRPPADEPITRSALDAALFYELLLGEIQLRQGDPGTAYRLLLEAAKRTKDETLFRRATDIALQARAGDQSLAAVAAWRQTLPGSVDALRYHVQLLVALNRIADTEEPLVSLLRTTPRPALAGVIEATPRFLARAPDRAAVANLIERALQPFTDAPDTRVPAWVAMGRGWLATNDTARALVYAERAAAADRSADGPALLALEMLPATPAAEALVQARVAAEPAAPAVHLLYVRTLAASQRLVEAAAQASVLTQKHPQLAPPWLTLAAVHLELRQPEPAATALETYVGLVEGGAPVNIGAVAPANDADDGPATPSSALTQAWLLLAQAAEQRRDFAAAEKWLAKIDNPQRALEVQSRRASLLAKQGRLAEARLLVRRAPEQTAADARAKLLAESELLRDAKQWQELVRLLADAQKAFPDDSDLIYEQAMAEEKLERMDEMERLLRRVIALKPDNPHAYNALGYSLADRKLRLTEARDLIRKALELSPNEPFITDSLGWVEYRLGNRDEAIRLLKIAYQARPDVEIAAHLGEVLWSAGQTEEARKVWREGRMRDASNDTLNKTLARLRVDL